MDRLAISEATLELNNELIEQDIRLQLFMCEHYDTSITAIGKQNEYNNFIRQPCDIFINLPNAGDGFVEAKEKNLSLIPALISLPSAAR